MISKKRNPAYLLISELYKDKLTARPKVPLMKHIDEGLDILENLNADNITMEAFCLHPILQSDKAFNDNYESNFGTIRTASLLLAMEYRRVANSYLSSGEISKFVGFTNNRIKQMLIADKVQNEKDFVIYHEGKHPRTKELRKYFNNWFELLEIVEVV